MDKKEVASVHQYNAKHPADPRGHLLLGRGYLNRHWLKDALGEYAIALSVNRDARGDPRLLPDLIQIVALGASEAGRLIVDTYGTAPGTAIAVERALLASANPEVKSRLERLKGDLPRPSP